MLDSSIIEFCKDNAISIKRFLKDNFVLESYSPKVNKRNKKWKIKHSEIAGMFNVVPVSLLFAYRYKELVAMGKILIVEDECGKFNAYINPRIIIESYGLDPEECIEAVDPLEEQFSLKTFELADTEENLRIIKHFNGASSLTYTHRIINAIEEDTKNSTNSRKRVEKKHNIC